MNKDLTKILAASGGAFIGGAAIKMTKQSPMASLGAAGLGIYLAMKGKNDTTKSLGLGLGAIGVVGTLAKVAEKIPALGKFAPTINGIGDLYEDENGNIIELGGINGPQLVQDENGNTYMVGGVDGSDIDDLMGIDGSDIDDLMGLDGDYDDEYELAGLV